MFPRKYPSGTACAKFDTGWKPFLSPNERRQSTEGRQMNSSNNIFNHKHTDKSEGMINSVPALWWQRISYSVTKWCVTNSRSYGPIISTSVQMSPRTMLALKRKYSDSKGHILIFLINSDEQFSALTLFVKATGNTSSLYKNPASATHKGRLWRPVRTWSYLPDK